MPLTQNEDVYETSDLPEDDQHLKATDERFESDAIERVQLDVADAFNKFKGKALATDDVDFSDSLVKRRRRGYGGGSYVLELIGTESGQPETPEQKFNRLHHEINELSEQLQTIKSSAEKGDEAAGSVTAADVLGLQQQLKGLQIEQILGTQAQLSVVDPQAAVAKKLADNINRLKEKAGKEGGTEGQVHVSYQLTHSGIDADQRLIALESRLKRLESAVGGEGSGASVAEALEDLQHRVQLVDGNQLEGLDARLTSLLQKLTQVQEKKKEAGEADVDEQRVNELLELMNKWDNSCAALPALVDRMHSLQKLHEQAMQFSQALTQLDGVQQQLVKSVETDSKLLQELKAGMAENMQTLRNNCESLEKRLKVLGK